MSDTSIEWTSGPDGEPGYTLNPWGGCVEEHAGCTHCYAKALPPSMRRGAKWGQVWAGGQRIMAPEKYLANAFKWAREAAAAGQRRKVFVASVADVLEVPEIPDSWPRGWTEQQIAEALQRVRETMEAMNAQRERLWDIIEDTAWVCGGCRMPCAHSSDTPHRTARLLELKSAGAACEGINGVCLNSPMSGLDFLLLTKRPQNYGLVPLWARALAWLGTSVSDQETMNEYGARLLQARGFRYRFLSMEPLLGPVDLSRWMGWWRCPDCGTARDPTTDQPLGTEVLCRACPNDAPIPIEGRHIDQVIVGGESGRKARPCEVSWIRDIVRQCREAGTACFVKQLGAQAMDQQETWNDWRARGASFVNHTDGMGRVILAHPKGGDWAEWSADLQVREWPGGQRAKPPT
jgi:protein gp37